MDYIKIRFSKDVDQFGSKLRETIDDMFQDINPMFCLSERYWKPQMDIYETAEEIVIRAEIAGVDKEDLEVEISSRAVRIQGDRTARHCTPDSSYRLAEIQDGRFERVIFLPVPIDPEIVSATYANGFLEIRLAKQSQERTHKVQISEG